jgi:DNA-binding transcriptional ArsR family regulator
VAAADTTSRTSCNGFDPGLRAPWGGAQLTDSVDRLTLTFAARADPTRRAILTQLADGEATVNELAQRFPITVQAVSKHLGVLERAGLITRARSAQLRPSRLRAEPLVDAADWLGSYQRFWDAGFDRLEDRVRALDNERRRD